MKKTDLIKQHKSYYSAKTKPEKLVIGPAHFISCTDTGDPSGKPFSLNVEAMYTVAYTLKFQMKEMGEDFVVAKLQAQWWFDLARFPNVTLSTAPLLIPRSEWNYRLLIRLPDFITPQQVTIAIEKARLKKKDLPNIQHIHFHTMDEGEVVQILHIGPFEREPETLQQLQQYMTNHGLQQNGLHHEIYLSDFRKTSPASLKTILREPVTSI